MSVLSNTQQRIEDFKKRAETEREFCEELFKLATIRLLAHKWAYYIMNRQFIEDIAYDLEEKGWYVMGMALGLIKEDETSPCVDFDINHPLAQEAIKYAKNLKFR